MSCQVDKEKEEMNFFGHVRSYLWIQILVFNLEVIFYWNNNLGSKFMIPRRNILYMGRIMSYFTWISLLV